MLSKKEEKKLDQLLRRMEDIVKNGAGSRGEARRILSQIDRLIKKDKRDTL